MGPQLCWDTSKEPRGESKLLENLRKSLVFEVQMTLRGRSSMLIGVIALSQHDLQRTRREENGDPFLHCRLAVRSLPQHPPHQHTQLLCLNFQTNDKKLDHKPLINKDLVLFYMTLVLITGHINAKHLSALKW